MLADLVGPTGSVLGIDSAAVVVDVARTTDHWQSRHGNLRYEVGDVTNLDLPDDSFDVEHAHQVPQHLPIRSERCARWPVSRDPAASWPPGTPTTPP